MYELRSTNTNSRTRTVIEIPTLRGTDVVFIETYFDYLNNFCIILDLIHLLRLCFTDDQAVFTCYLVSLLKVKRYEIETINLFIVLIYNDILQSIKIIFTFRIVALVFD